uniref:Protein Wnt n=1 Tax=Halisarca dujardinii TaxID=2583056 RepID=A0A175C231_HALDU
MTFLVLVAMALSLFALVVENGAAIAKCQDVYDLTYSQRQFCRVNRELLPIIEKAEASAMRECQFLFKSNRWNCSGFGVLRSSYTKEVATAETAFQLALMSAVLAKNIAQACKEGSTSLCSCGRTATLPTGAGQWYFASCSENIGFGQEVSRRFLDEAEHDRGLGLRQLSRLQDLAVGRAVLAQLAAAMGPQCRCQGLSGACSIRTCRTMTPPLGAMGQQLLSRYGQACRVTLEPAGPHTHTLALRPACGGSIATDTLIYSDSSPNYCLPDLTRGSYGTRGRRCDRRAPPTHPESCSSLCCGRGFQLVQTTAAYHCGCRFENFQIKCDECQSTVTLSVCR